MPFRPVRVGRRRKRCPGLPSRTGRNGNHPDPHRYFRRAAFAGHLPRVSTCLLHRSARRSARLHRNHGRFYHFSKLTPIRTKARRQCRRAFLIGLSLLRAAHFRTGCENMSRVLFITRHTSSCLRQIARNLCREAATKLRARGRGVSPRVLLWVLSWTSKKGPFPRLTSFFSHATLGLEGKNKRIERGIAWI